MRGMADEGKDFHERIEQEAHKIARTSAESVEAIREKLLKIALESSVSARSVEELAEAGRQFAVDQKYADNRVTRRRLARVRASAERREGRASSE